MTAQVISTPSFDSLQTAVNNGGTITLAFDGTVTVTNTLQVVFDTVIDATGHSVTLNGGNAVPIFSVDPGVTLTVINATISGGNNTGATGATGITGTSGSSGGTGGAGGTGADALGGAVYNAGTNNFLNCTFLNNVVFGGQGGLGGTGGNGSGIGGTGGNGGAGGRGLGGAIYNLGTVLLSNCTFSGNSAVGGDGGAGGARGSGSFAYAGPGGSGAIGGGAGLYNAGRATIVACTFNNNGSFGGSSATAGGPPPNNNGPNGLPGAMAGGGAVFNAGTNTIVNCTFYQNSATGGNGGNGGNATTGPYKGTGGNGGDATGGSVYNAASGLTSITNCSFASGIVIGGTNGAYGGGSFVNGTSLPGTASGGNIGNGGGAFNFRNSFLTLSTNGFNAGGTITDQGNNLSSDASPVFTTTNSFTNRDPQAIVPPSSHGGVTLTIGLHSTSPAIDAIYDGSAPPTDQRGLARPSGARSDIGSYEFGATSNNFTIAGRVMLGTNAFPGVAVKIGSFSSLTDSNGNYSLLLGGNVSYAVIPQPQGYFNPGSTNLMLSADALNVNFMATNAVTTVARGTNGSNSVVFTFSAVPTFTYRIQAATNLVSTNFSATNWVDIATNTATNGVILFTNFNVSTNFPRRFFRAVTP